MFLSRKNYFFKLKAFAKNYDKRELEGSQKGVYINLDFGHLVELSKMDKCLRDLVLGFTLDIEHYLKVRINDSAMRCQINPYEVTDSFFRASAENVTNNQIAEYSRDEALRALDEMHSVLSEHSANEALEAEIMVEIANSLSKSLERITTGSKPDYVQDSFKAMRKSHYSKGLVKKYGNDSPMPFWCLMELMSFGQLIGFYKACFKKGGLIPDDAETETFRKVKNLLRCSQELRNAAAHGDCLLNGLSDYGKSKSRGGVWNAIKNEGLDTDAIHQVRSVHVAMDVAALLLCYDIIVPEGTTRRIASEELSDASARFTKNRDWFVKNYSIVSFVDFFGEMARLFAVRFES